MAMDFGKLKDPAFLTAAGQTLQQMAWAPVRPVEGLGNPMLEYQQAAQTKATENKTLQWLQQNDPEAFQYAQAGLPVNDAFNYAIKKQQTAQAPKNNWISVGNGMLFNKDTGEYKTPPAEMMQQQGQPEYFGNPVYYEEAGKLRIGLPGKDGTFRPLDIPGQVLPGFNNVDTGTQIIRQDKRTGQPLDVIQKDIAGAEQQKAAGKLTGEAMQALPATLAKADQAIATIDKALQHPGRETATGASGTWDPRNYLPGTNARDFLEVNKQLKGQTFLEAYQSLKGGGQITEVEGAKAEAAIARLETAQSDEAYVQALIELRQIIMNGRERAKQMAGQQPSASQQADPNVEDLLNKYGN